MTAHFKAHPGKEWPAQWVTPLAAHRNIHKVSSPRVAGSTECPVGDCESG